jgi:hypothetical protein
MPKGIGNSVEMIFKTYSTNLSFVIQRYFFAFSSVVYLITAIYAMVYTKFNFVICVLMVGIGLFFAWLYLHYNKYALLIQIDHDRKIINFVLANGTAASYEFSDIISITTSPLITFTFSSTKIYYKDVTNKELHLELGGPAFNHALKRTG